MNDAPKCRGSADSHNEFRRFLLRSAPRLLTQLDRDPDSPTFGCFDRDFWHYRSRDFSSIILQQGALCLQTLYWYEDPENFLYQEQKVLSWIDASLRFWASQQLHSGAFDEFYPHEEGFPPTAFSLYAVALIFQRRGFPEAETEVLHAIQKAADWLLCRRERQAMNQEAVALTALALSSRIPSVTVDTVKLNVRFDLFFAAQSLEGWFPEYGGADTGYLSVTLDALAVYYDLTGDKRAEVAMDRTLGFMSILVSVSGSTPVMTNSRDTDYIVPYGLIRMAERSPLARTVFETLFRNPENPLHFLNATDDRYLCHYIYQSCIRGLEHLSGMTAQKEKLPYETGADRFYPEAGIHVLHTPGARSIYTATRKGGIYYLYNTKGIVFADYGWRYKTGHGRVALTHWQHPDYHSTFSQDAGSTRITISGGVYIHGWPESTPLRHAALRVLSYFLGGRIKSLLKKILIIKAEGYGMDFRREIVITGTGINCSDMFSGEGVQSFDPVPAAAYSLRYTPSAGNFNSEELSWGVGINRVYERKGETLVINNSLLFAEVRD